MTFNPYPVNTLQDVNNDELKAERTKRASNCEKEEEERKDRKEVITQGERESGGNEK